MEEKKRREEYIRTYVSPWERAMKGDEDLVATMKSSMPGPIQIHPEPPTFKSFNRYEVEAVTMVTTALHRWGGMVAPPLSWLLTLLPLIPSRTALPYGGYDKASKLLTFELPEVIPAADEAEPLPSLQADIRSRPSFNRTPIGWVCSEDNSHIHMELDSVPFDGETDDL